MPHDHTNDQHPEMAGNPGGDSVPLRPERGLDRQGDPQSNAPTEAGREPQPNPLEGLDFNQLRDNPLLLAQVTAYLQENHLHLPLLTPDREEMKAMREETPELYDVYITGLRKSVEADYIQRIYPYTEPLKNVNSGRKYGLAAFFIVMAVAAYALYLGHEWFAGIIIGLDVVGLIAVFGNHPEASKKQ